MSEVSLLKTESYNPELLRERVARHFSQLKITLDSAAHVVVKPNLIMRCSPERAATVHPVLLGAVLAQLRDMGVRDVVVAESPGGPFTPILLKALFEKTGIAAVAEQYDVPCSLSTGSHILRRKDNQFCREFDIMDAIAENTFLINVCKVKTHSMMLFSGGVKNLFGCIPGLLKPQLHYRFPQEDRFAGMLLDLSQTLCPALTVVDGVVGMEGDGPTAGMPRPLGITAAARFDGLYALDEMLVRMIGLPPEKVPTIVEARRRALIPPAYSVLGDSDLAETVTPFRLPKGKSLDFAANAGVFGSVIQRLRPYLAPRPMIRVKACVGCGKCAETCPAHVIEIVGRKASIHPKGCIHCFCCHEMCPEQAIDIREMGLFRWLSR